MSCEQRLEHLRPELIGFLRRAQQYFGVKLQLIAIVLKNQALVVACLSGDLVDPCSGKPLAGESSSAASRIAFRAPAALWVRPRFVS